MQWRSGAPSSVATQGLCLNPGQLYKRNHVPLSLSWCGSWGSSPARGTATWGCSTLFCGSCSWNHEPPIMGIAAALLILRRLFLSVGAEWGVDGKSTTPSVNTHGRSLIERPTTLSKWPPPWRLWICVQIWRRQGELSKDHCLDRSCSSKWPNL